MPWIVKKTDRCKPTTPWGVFNQATGRLVACHPTQESARKQQTALYANVKEPTTFVG